jgi:hypothetical protein
MTDFVNYGAGDELYAAKLNSDFLMVIALASQAVTTAQQAGSVSNTASAGLAAVLAALAEVTATAASAVQTINEIHPDGSGNVALTIPGGTVKKVNGVLPDGTGAVVLGAGDLPYTAGANISITGNVIASTGGGGGGPSYVTPAYTDFTETNFASGTSGAKSAAGTITIHVPTITSYAHNYSALMKPIPSSPKRYIAKILNPNNARQANNTGFYVESGTGQLLTFCWNTAGTLNISVNNDYIGTGNSLQETIYVNNADFMWFSLIVGTPDLVATGGDPARIALAYSFNGVDWYQLGQKLPFGASGVYAKAGFGCDSYSTLDYEWNNSSTPRYVTCEQWIESVPTTMLG